MTTTPAQLVEATVFGYLFCRAATPRDLPADATEVVVAYYRYCALVLTLAERRRRG